MDASITALLVLGAVQFMMQRSLGAPSSSSNGNNGTAANSGSNGTASSNNNSGTAANNNSRSGGPDGAVSMANLEALLRNMSSADPAAGAKIKEDMDKLQKALDHSAEEKRLNAEALGKAEKEIERLAAEAAAAAAAATAATVAAEEFKKEADKYILEQRAEHEKALAAALATGAGSDEDKICVDALKAMVLIDPSKGDCAAMGTVIRLAKDGDGGTLEDVVNEAIKERQQAEADGYVRIRKKAPPPNIANDKDTLVINMKQGALGLPNMDKYTVMSSIKDIDKMFTGDPIQVHTHPINAKATGDAAESLTFIVNKSGVKIETKATPLTHKIHDNFYKAFVKNGDAAVSFLTLPVFIAHFLGYAENDGDVAAAKLAGAEKTAEDAKAATVAANERATLAEAKAVAADVRAAAAETAADERASAAEAKTAEEVVKKEEAKAVAKATAEAAAEVAKAAEAAEAAAKAAEAEVAALKEQVDAVKALISGDGGSPSDATAYLAFLDDTRKKDAGWGDKTYIQYIGDLRAALALAQAAAAAAAGKVPIPPGSEAELLKIIGSDVELISIVGEPADAKVSVATLQSLCKKFDDSNPSLLFIIKSLYEATDAGAAAAAAAAAQAYKMLAIRVVVGNSSNLDKDTAEAIIGALDEKIKTKTGLDEDMPEPLNDNDSSVIKAILNGAVVTGINEAVEDLSDRAKGKVGDDAGAAAENSEAYQKLAIKLIIANLRSKIGSDVDIGNLLDDVDAAIEKVDAGNLGELLEKLEEFGDDAAAAAALIDNVLNDDADTRDEVIGIVEDLSDRVKASEDKKGDDDADADGAALRLELKECKKERDDCVGREAALQAQLAEAADARKDEAARLAKVVEDKQGEVNALAQALEDASAAAAASSAAAAEVVRLTGELAAAKQALAVAQAALQTATDSHTEAAAAAAVAATAATEAAAAKDIELAALQAKLQKCEDEAALGLAPGADGDDGRLAQALAHVDRLTEEIALLQLRLDALPPSGDSGDRGDGPDVADLKKQLADAEAKVERFKVVNQDLSDKLTNALSNDDSALALLTCHAKVNDLEDKLRRLARTTVDKDETEAQIAGLEEQLATAGLELAAKQEDLQTAQDAAGLGADKDTEIDRLKAEIAALTETIAGLEKQIETLRGQLAAQPVPDPDAAAAANNAADDADADNAAADDVEDLASKIRGLEDELAAAEAELVPLKAELADLKDTNSDANKALAAGRQQLEDDKAAFADAKDGEAEAAEAALAAKQQELDDKQQELDDSKSALQARIKKLEDEVIRLKAEIEKLQAQLDAAASAAAVNADADANADAAAANGALKQEVAALRIEVDAKAAELGAAAQAAADTLLALQDENARLRSDLQNCEANLQLQADDARVKGDDIDKKIQAAEDDLKKTRKDLKAAEDAKGEADQALAAAKDEAAAAKDEAAAAKQASDLAKGVDVADKAAAEAKAEAADKRAADADKKAADADKRAEAAEADVKLQVGNNADLVERIRELEARVAELEAEILKLKAEKDAAEGKSAGLEAQLGAVVNDAARLNATEVEAQCIQLHNTLAGFISDLWDAEIKAYTDMLKIEDTLVDIKARQKAAQEDRLAFQSANSKTSIKIEECFGKLDDLTKQLDARINKLEGVISEIAGLLQGMAAEAGTQKAELTRVADDLKAAVDKVKADADRTKTELAALKAEAAKQTSGDKALWKAMLYDEGLLDGARDGKYLEYFSGNGFMLIPERVIDYYMTWDKEGDYVVNVMTPLSETISKFHIPMSRAFAKHKDEGAHKGQMTNLYWLMKDMELTRTTGHTEEDNLGDGNGNEAVRAVQEYTIDNVKYQTTNPLFQNDCLYFMAILARMKVNKKGMVPSVQTSIASFDLEANKDNVITAYNHQNEHNTSDFRLCVPNVAIKINIVIDQGSDVPDLPFNIFYTCKNSRYITLLDTTLASLADSLQQVPEQQDTQGGSAVSFTGAGPVATLVPRRSGFRPILFVLQTGRLSYYAYAAFYNKVIDAKVLIYDLVYSVGCTWLLCKMGVIDEEAAQSVLIRVLISWVVVYGALCGIKALRGAAPRPRETLAVMGVTCLLTLII